MYQWREKAPDQNRTHKKGRQRSRQRCGHCQQFLSNLQYHEHRRLFFDATFNEWTNRPCKLAAISRRFVTLKLKKMPSKSPQNQSVFEIAAILWQQIATKSLHGRFGIATKIAEKIACVNAPWEKFRLPKRNGNVSWINLGARNKT